MAASRPISDAVGQVVYKKVRDIRSSTTCLGDQGERRVIAVLGLSKCEASKNCVFKGTNLRVPQDP